MSDKAPPHLSTYDALDFAHTGMCVVRDDYEVIFWNKRLVEWTSITKDQITGKNISEFCPAIKEQRNTIRLSEIFKGGPPVIFSSQIHKHLFPAPLANGNLRIQHVTVTAIPSLDSKIFFALFAIEDVTELTLRMSELDKARNDAEMANRSKSDFLANMSHEIRTPMNGVLGMCNILMQTGLSDDQQSYVHMIERSGRALLTIINDILDFSKIEAGKMTLTPVPCDLKKTITDLIELFQFSAEKKDILFNARYDDSCPKYFITDDGRIRQVLTNLISNAIKFTEQGSITVTFSSIPIDDSHASIRISIKDTGIGIADDVQPILFNKFIQVDSSLTRRFQGTGLGLAITKQLCKLMGGDITMSSHLGEGSEFIISLPLRLANEEQAKVLYNTSLNSKSTGEKLSIRAQVLLVEDNQINQAVAVHILRNLNCIVEVAENGRDAIEKIQHQYFDAVFMDCQMPVLDGYSATRLIRNLEKTAGRHTPIIAMTAHAMEGDREKCIECGMDDYISKPVEPSSFSTVLEKFCRHRKCSSHSVLQPSILIADDEVIALRELNEIVKHVFPGAIINHATDGVEACMLLGNFRPDIFICDIMIPNMDGEAVISYMKRNRQFSRTRIIVVTALSVNDQSVGRIKDMGVTGIIFKPVAKDKLRNLILSIYPDNVSEERLALPVPQSLNTISIDYRGMVECLLHGIGVFQKTRFIYGNAALSRIFKTPLDTILIDEYSELFTIIHPEDREIAEKLFGINTLTEKTSQRRVVRFVTPEETLFIDIYSCAIQQNYETARLIMATDITDWISSNANIDTYHNAIEHTNHEWTDFISSLTNELRNPLSTIIGATRIIYCDSLSDRQQRQIALIDESTSLMAALVNELNDHTIDVLDSFPVSELSFDLYIAVQEVTKLVAPRIFSHNLEFIVNYDHQLENRFIGDPARIRQILTHLLSHALEETSEGYIALLISQQRNDPNTSVQLSFSVQYTGIIPKSSVQECSVTPVYRTNLSFARSIAITLGGTLEFFHCEQNPQYKFVISLEPDSQAVETSVDLSILNGVRVLYAERNPHISSVLIEHLKQSGMLPEFCDHPETIIAKIHDSYRESNPFLITILDYTPDDQDVLEIAQAIKNDPLAQNTSLLMLTNTGKRGDATKVKTAGIDGYLVKPAFPMELEKICALILFRAKQGITSGLVTRHTILETSNEDCDTKGIVKYDTMTIMVIIGLKFLRENIVSMLSSFKCATRCAQTPKDLLQLTDKVYDLVIIDWNDIQNNNDLIKIIRQFKNIQFEQSPIVTLVNNLTALISHKNISDNFFALIEKPVSISSLKKVLDSIGILKTQNEESSVNNLHISKLQDIPESILSINSLLDRLGNDMEFATDLLLKFAAALPVEIAELESCFNNSDLKKVELVAHRIKGAARNLSVNEIMNVLQEVETAARVEDIDQIKSMFPKVHASAEQFIWSLKSTS